MKSTPTVITKRVKRLSSSPRWVIRFWVGVERDTMKLPRPLKEWEYFFLVEGFLAARWLEEPIEVSS